MDMAVEKDIPMDVREYNRLKNTLNDLIKDATGNWIEAHKPKTFDFAIAGEKTVIVADEIISSEEAKKRKEA